MDPERIQVRAIASGLVQGVWYRASTQTKALELGVSGTVRNLPDRTVEIVAWGPRGAVEALLEWAREGPPHARVEAVAVTEEPLGDDPGPFTIVR